MDIRIEPGASVRVSRSRNGEIVFVEREEGTTLIKIDDGCLRMTLENAPQYDFGWRSVMENDEKDDFWKLPFTFVAREMS